MGTTNTITNLTLAGLLLTCLGCERGLNRRQTEFAEETWLNACNDLKAQVKGMDEEIDLRLWRVWDVKWKDKIYHVVEPGLVDQMRRTKRPSFRPERSERNWSIAQTVWFLRIK